MRHYRALLYPLTDPKSHITLPVNHITVISRAFLSIPRRRFHINVALDLTNMSKPSILLIPGSFALPEFYDPIVDAVVAKGYEIRALHLPSVGLKTGQGREGAPPTMYDDAAFIAKEAERRADEGKDVILIGHSYGGVPVTQSAKGLGTKERQKQGKTGGIVHLAYITSLVPAVGTSAAAVLADVPKEHQLDLKIDVRLLASSFLPFLSLLFTFHSILINIGNRKGAGCTTTSPRQLLQSYCRTFPQKKARPGLGNSLSTPQSVSQVN